MRTPLLDLWDACLRKRSISMAVVVLLLVDLVLGVFVLLPFRQRVGLLESRAGQMRAEARASRMQYVSRRELAERVHRTLVECARFRAEVAGTSASRYLVFKRTVERIVGLGGGTTDRIAFKTSSLDSGFLEQTAALELEGSYGRIRQIVSQLLNSDEFIIIESISLSGARPNRGAAQSTASLRIATVFSQRPADRPLDPLAELPTVADVSDGTAAEGPAVSDPPADAGPSAPRRPLGAPHASLAEPAGGGA